MTKQAWDKAAGVKRDPPPKHIRIAPEQTLTLHVTEDGAVEGVEIGAYILTADKDGVVRMNALPAPGPPVMDPHPNSGT